MVRSKGRAMRLRQAMAAAAPVKPPPITQRLGRVRVISFPSPVKAKSHGVRRNRRPWAGGGGLVAEGTNGPLYQSTCMRAPNPLMWAPSNTLFVPGGRLVFDAVKIG